MNLSSLLRAVMLLSISLCLTSCFSGSDLPSFEYGPPAPGGQQTYSPKALEEEKPSHAIGINYDTYPSGYYPGDQLQNLGQLDYNFSYKLKRSYINLTASLGSDRYSFGDPLIGIQTTYQNFFTAGFEYGGYTDFNNSKFEWRYIQVQGGIILGGGSYHNKMEALDYVHNNLNGDGFDSLYFEYSGSNNFYIGLSTELQYSISDEWRIGGQLGTRVEPLNMGYSYLTLFAEYEQMGMYAIITLDDSGERTDSMGDTYQGNSRNHYPSIGAYFRF